MKTQGSLTDRSLPLQGPIAFVCATVEACIVEKFMALNPMKPLKSLNKGQRRYALSADQTEMHLGQGAA
ncbi:MAG: hypothetical protein V4739_09510 [Pseudomonadota bacterium]